MSTTSTMTSDATAAVINLLSIHDVHLGHDSTTTPEVIAALHTAIPDTDPFIKTLNYLLYPGDLFDRLLHLPNHGVPAIRAELRRQLTLAQHYGFAVMILEGTPSHDWKQSKMVESVAAELGYTGELHYIDRLCVVTSNQGHTFLFVPDEWRANNEKTYREAVEAIHAAGLEQVDFILFHGQFDYQIKELSLTLPCHDSDRWQGLVRHYLFAGHIHKPSQHGKILVAGSLERLRHNEEHPKGHLRVTVDTKNGDVVQFVENTNAKTYLTFDVRDMDAHDIYHFAVTESAKYRPGSYLRLHGSRAQGIKGIVSMLKDDVSDYVWGIKLEKSINDIAPVVADAVDDEGPRESKQLTKPVMLEECVHRLMARGLKPEVLEKALKLARSTLC